MNLAVLGGNEERLVDVGTYPAPCQRGFGEQIESSPHRVAFYRELGNRGVADNPVLRPAIQAAAQVISRKSSLESHLDAGAAGRERNLVRVMTDQGIDVGLRGRDAFGVRSGH